MTGTTSLFPAPAGRGRLRPFRQPTGEHAMKVFSIKLAAAAALALGALCAQAADMVVVQM